jgi:flagellar biosynthesis chaperone FliJ
LLLSGDERSSIPFSLSGTQFVNISQNYKLFDLQLIPELKSYLSQKMISRMEEQIAFLEEHIEELQENLEITTLRLNYLQMKNYESNASIIELTTLCNQLREERDIAIDHISNMSQKNFDSFDQNFSEVDT